MRSFKQKTDPLMHLHNVPIHMKLGFLSANTAQQSKVLATELLSYDEPLRLVASNADRSANKIVFLPRPAQTDPEGYQLVLGIPDGLTVSQRSTRASRPRVRRARPMPKAATEMERFLRNS